ncbi:hypothetical protein ACFL9U_12110 [Thermodesulfobacteriota bacterium]
MDAEMIQKIDAVMDRVKDPESNLSITQLGLVERFRYNDARNKLYVFINSIRNAKICCAVMSMALLSSTLKQLSEELQNEFPDLSIEIIEPNIIPRYVCT